MTSIRIGLVDDDDLMRAGLKMIIEQSDGLEVVGEAANGDEAVQLASRTPLDLLLVDVRMPGMNGIDATRIITTAADAPRVVILTTFEHDEYVFEALRAGASAFLLKRTPPEDLIDAIRLVFEGEAMLSPSVTRRLIEEFASGPIRSPKLDPALAALTEREREVLMEMAKGLSNEEIGETLFIAANTVKTHAKRVLSKLGARDRVQAVVMAYENGLMD